MTKDDHLIEFLTRLQGCGDYDSSWRLFTQVVAELGFTQNALCLFIPGEILDESANIVLTNYHPDFVAAYEEQGGLQNDSTLQWITSTDQILYWSDPENLTLVRKKHLPIEELSQDFNILNGASFPLKTRYSGSIHCIGLSATDSRKNEYERDVKRNLDLAIAMSRLLEMHLYQFELHQMLEDEAAYSEMQPLHPLEQETIRWLSNGYSIKEVADKKMFKSIESINLYIKKAKQKLQVRTRDQLIARAVLLGLV
ncbi:MAG: LuxR family transcriptional regulator [Gammaproteobacteria bacterium]|nr:LuxR family transcriptional regulator [Gammaproteobacteria bacterium]